HEQAGNGVPVDQVVGNELLTRCDDPRLVTGNPLELDRAGEIDARDVIFDQVGVVQVAGDQLPAAANAGRVAIQVLKLHLAGQINARRVGKNLVGQGQTDETQPSDGSRYRAANAGDIVVNEIGAERGGGAIRHADGGPMNVIVLNKTS